MKEKIKRAAGFCIALLLTAVLVHYLGIVVRPLNMDTAINAIDAFHSLEKNSVDVICFGSSHMWRGMDPAVMQDKYGIRAYNYGCYWQKMNTTLLFVEDSLRTQSPEIAVIDTFYANRLKSDSFMDGELYSTRKVKGRSKFKYLRQCFGNDITEYFAYFVPLCAFHDNWTELTADSFRINADDTDFTASKGFAGSGRRIPSSLGGNSAEQKPLSAEAVKNLDKIVEICRENGITIIFVTIPYNEEYEYADAMAAYAEQNDCFYINFFDCIEDTGFDCQTDYSDGAHLNTSGAGKIADYLGRYITENGLL